MFARTSTELALAFSTPLRKHHPDQSFTGYRVMSKKVITFEYEKETKNSVRYKEVPDEGTAPIVGSLYVQKWFVGESKTLEVTIDKKG